MRSFVFACLAVVSWVLVPGCKTESGETTKKQVFADLFVRYFAEDQSLKAQALFFEGENLEAATPIEPSGSVSFQGTAMEKKELQASVIRFEVDRNQAFSGDAPFRFQLDGGKWEEVNLKMEGLADFFIRDNPRLGEGLTVIAKGAVLEKEESLVVMLADENRKSAAYELKGPAAASEIRIPPSRLTGLQAGVWAIYLVKKRHEVVERGKLTVYADQEYYSPAINFEMGE